MKIKRSPLFFNNLLSVKSKCKPEEWHISARELRNAVIKNGMYATGPIIYQVSKNMLDNESEYTFYLPVNVSINMPDNDKYSFYKLWNLEDGFMFRHVDLNESLETSYQLLRACAEAYNLSLKEPFYNIYLDVYGDGIIDIYAPIVKEG